MVRVTVASAEVPAEFVATSVNWVAGKGAVGVPEMTQVEASTLSVPGKADALAEPGLTPQAVSAAPLLASVVGDTRIAVPTSATVPAAPAQLTARRAPPPPPPPLLPPAAAQTRPTPAPWPPRPHTP